MFRGVKLLDLGSFKRGEDAAPQRGVDGVRDLNINAEFYLLCDRQSAPVLRVAEVEGWCSGSIKKWFAIGARAEAHLCRHTPEIAGENFAHFGMRADPVRAVEGWAESRGAASFPSIQSDEFGGIEWRGGHLPDPDVDVTSRKLPAIARQRSGNWCGCFHPSISSWVPVVTATMRDGETIRVTQKCSPGCARAKNRQSASKR